MSSYLLEGLSSRTLDFLLCIYGTHDQTGFKMLGDGLVLDMYVQPSAILITDHAVSIGHWPWYDELVNMLPLLKIQCTGYNQQIDFVKRRIPPYLLEERVAKILSRVDPTPLLLSEYNHMALPIQPLGFGYYRVTVTLDQLNQIKDV